MTVIIAMLVVVFSFGGVKKKKKKKLICWGGCVRIDTQKLGRVTANACTHAQSVAKESRRPTNKSERVGTPQDGRKRPNSLGRGTELHRGTTEAWRSRGRIGNAHAHAERSNRGEDDCKNSRSHQENPKGAETAKLTCWRENSAHRAEETTRMSRPSVRAYRALMTTRKRLKMRVERPESVRRAQQRKTHLIGSKSKQGRGEGPIAGVDTTLGVVIVG